MGRNHKMMYFVNYLMKTLQKVTNADITQITKVGAHVKTSGWGNRFLTVFNNVISEYRVSLNQTELIKTCICYFKPNIKSQQYKQNNVLMFYSYYFSKASNLQTKKPITQTNVI